MKKKTDTQKTNKSDFYRRVNKEISRKFAKLNEIKIWGRVGVEEYM